MRMLINFKNASVVSVRLSLKARFLAQLMRASALQFLGSAKAQIDGLASAQAL